MTTFREPVAELPLISLLLKPHRGPLPKTSFCNTVLSSSVLCAENTVKLVMISKVIRANDGNRIIDVTKIVASVFTILYAL